MKRPLVWDWIAVLYSTRVFTISKRTPTKYIYTVVIELVMQCMFKSDGTGIHLVLVTKCETVTIMYYYYNILN